MSGDQRSLIPWLTNLERRFVLQGLHICRWDDNESHLDRRALDDRQGSLGAEGLDALEIGVEPRPIERALGPRELRDDHRDLGVFPRRESGSQARLIDGCHSLEVIE
jgi:hypothetical protein